MVRRAALSVFVSAVLVTAIPAAVRAQSPSAATRDLAFNSFNNYFYVGNGGNAYYRDNTNTSGRNPNFWQNAEMIEIAEDAYDRTRNPAWASMVAALCNGFIGAHGTDWSGNIYNDDIMWAAIAFARAKVITGNDTYGQIGAANFNRVWYRAWDSSLGGGLWWTTARTSKNACVNGPGAIAALLFYRMNYGANYLNQARQIYDWQRSRLVDVSNGRVADHIRADGGVDWSAFTYNQGTYAGAAALLHQTVGGSTYANDGRLAVRWCRDNLTGQHVAGILNDEYFGGGGNSDGPGFKGIFARWACYWIRSTGDTQFNSWMQQNANAAWAYRNSSGVTWSQWWHRTPDPFVTAWECSSAVSLLQNCP